jgi:Tol biopolymer transport system component
MNPMNRLIRMTLTSQESQHGAARSLQPQRSAARSPELGRESRPHGSRWFAATGTALAIVATLATAACRSTPSADIPPDAQATAAVAESVAADPVTATDPQGTAVSDQAVAPAGLAPDAAASTPGTPQSPGEPVGALVDEAEEDLHGDAPEEGVGLVPDPAVGGRLVRLTEPGCCTQPFWSADGRRVQFVDRPSPGAPAGIWAVDIARPGEVPELVVEGMAYYSADLAYRIEREGETTALVRLADGARWTVPAGGRAVSISPGGTRIAWQVSPNGVPAERRTAQVWVANLDGSEAREVASLPRGSLAGWLNDDVLLVRGRDRLDADEDVLWRLPLDGGERREIMRSERLSGVAVAPGGRWIAYYIARLADPAANGMWIAPTSGEGGPRRLDASLFGAYRWRDGERLLVVPMNAEAVLRGDQPSHMLVEVDAGTLAARPLTDPAVTSFKITGTDWAVSPDGRRVVFVESRDKSLWVLELPGEPE